jgi:hypothetical protein
MSLEVGEHIPKDYEQVFLDNLVKHSNKFIILSWAIPNQIGDGHVNCQPNDYIINELDKRGFTFNPIESQKVREKNVIWWFKNTFMVFFKKNENFINIITPCSRPENLHKISKSINIPNNNYRWIVVFDMDTLPEKSLIPENCEVHLFRDQNSKAGHAQRNYAISLIEKGYVYSNDDDTLLHPNLWEEIKYLNNDFISFSQINKNGSLRLIGDKIEVNHIDSHNFIVSKDIISDSKYIIDDYAADGYFAEECYKKSKNKIFINKVLSVYNQLR